MNPIKDIISSLFVWPLASVEQFNETDFQWRQVLPKILAWLPKQILFDIKIGLDYTDKTNQTRMFYVRIFGIFTMILFF